MSISLFKDITLRKYGLIVQNNIAVTGFYSEAIFKNSSVIT